MPDTLKSVVFKLVNIVKLKVRMSSVKLSIVYIMTPDLTSDGILENLFSSVNTTTIYDLN